jgi:predicted RNase H-related nuclease YkuK (DUF458 family)
VEATEATFQETNSATKQKGKKAKPEKLTSANKLRQKIQAEKQSSQEVSSQSWWRDQVEKMKQMSSTKRMVHLDAVSRNKRSQ